MQHFDFNFDNLGKFKQGLIICLVITVLTNNANFPVASLSFLIIAVLVFGELKNYFYGDEGHYYRFSVDTAFNE